MGTIHPDIDNFDSRGHDTQVTSVSDPLQTHVHSVYPDIYLGR